MTAILTAPKNGPGPGVVVLQEIFGLTESMRGVCEWLASRKFVALCPDLYCRVKPGAVLPESQADEARALRQQVNDDEAAGDAAAAIEHLKEHPSCNGKVAVVGYCWGGLLAYLTAALHEPDAAVSYYGTRIDTRLGEAGRISCPTLFHFGGLDKFSPPDVIEKVRGAFLDNPGVSIHVYPDADHAFARVGGHAYDVAAAEQANKRTLELLEKLR